MQETKFISWNVNGLRAAIKKGFFEYFDAEKADFFMIQETKMQEHQVEFLDDKGMYKDYYLYMNSAIKKGYSGTAIFTKHKPISVVYGFNGEHNDEGRTITLEYDNFYIVCVYSPNSKHELLRIDYRMEFDEALKEYLNSLKNNKNVILCGDLNVAHNEIDLTNPTTNHFNPGFSDQERQGFSALLDTGFIDTFRNLYPDTIKYSWWSYRMNARERNIGWRIDYFVMNKELADNIVDATIENGVFGSDHCPVSLTINV